MNNSLMLAKHQMQYRTRRSVKLARDTAAVAVRSAEMYWRWNLILVDRHTNYSNVMFRCIPYGI